jgi:uncharacterized membrane-anchored protein
MKTSIQYETTKVPAITPWFWAAKIMLTATGEALSDTLNNGIGAGFAFPLMLILVGLSLRWQLRQTRYRASPYWSVVTAIAIIGTSFADAWHVGLGISYTITTLGFALLLAGVFTYWYRSEGSLNIHTVTTRRREWLYWLTVMCSFALGTAAGDWTATNLGLSYFPSFLLFGGVLLVPLALYSRGKVNEVFCFWFAYTFTRPFGASWADYSDMPTHQGGLNLPQVTTAIYLGAISLFIVAVMALRRIGVVEPDVDTPSAGARYAAGKA